MSLKIIISLMQNGIGFKLKKIGIMSNHIIMIGLTITTKNLTFSGNYDIIYIENEKGVLKMRYIRAYRVWVDPVHQCPYRDYDFTLKTVTDILQLFEQTGEAFFFIDCATQGMRDTIDCALPDEYAEYVRFRVHEDF